jgi:CelD/BcsL family acetyltransferase involved in cellulose biosynthesis
VVAELTRIWSDRLNHLGETDRLRPGVAEREPGLAGPGRMSDGRGWRGGHSAPAGCGGASAGAPPLGTGTSLSTITGLAELEWLRPEWDDLADRDPTSGIFQRWQWVSLWYRHFSVGNGLRLLAVRDGGGRLIGLAPCSLARGTLLPARQLYLLGRQAWALSERFDVLLDPNAAGEAAAGLMRGWDGLSPSWDLLRLTTLPAGGALAKAALGFAREHRYAVQAKELVRVGAPLPESTESFYRSLSKGMKNNVNNYANRLRCGGHAFGMEIVEDAERLDEALAVFFDLHARRARADLQPRHVDRFATPARRAFLHAVAHALVGRGEFWACQLRIEGRVVAIQLCLVHRRRLTIYYSGFDPDWAAHGVMTVLTRRCIEAGIERGCRELDLLLGLSQSKVRWGGVPHPVLNLTIANRQPRSRLAFAVFALARRLEAGTKG